MTDTTPETIAMQEGDGERDARQTAAADEARMMVIRIVAGLGLIAWLGTLESQRYSPFVAVHYLGLAAIVVGITLEITGRVARLKPLGIPCAVVAVLLACWVWSNYYDTYRAKWFSRDGECRYFDTYRRSGMLIYREMMQYLSGDRSHSIESDHGRLVDKQLIGRFDSDRSHATPVFPSSFWSEQRFDSLDGDRSRSVKSDHGPMAGMPPTPHGHWVGHVYRRFREGQFDHLRADERSAAILDYTAPRPDHHNWYWYGEEITQGEWELRNK